MATTRKPAVPPTIGASADKKQERLASPQHLRPYKFVVKAIPQIVSENGQVLGEETGVNPVELFGCEALAVWARAFPEQLAELEREAK